MWSQNQSVPTSRHPAMKTSREKIRSVLHGHIDRPTPQRYCSTNLKSPKHILFVALGFSCPNRTIILFHQAQPRTNNLDKLETPEIFVIPVAGTWNRGVTQHCIYLFLWKLMYVYLMSIDTFKTLPLKWFLDRPEPFQFITLLHDQVVTICRSTGPGLPRLLFHLYILIH